MKPLETGNNRLRTENIFSLSIFCIVSIQFLLVLFNQILLLTRTYEQIDIIKLDAHLNNCRIWSNIAKDGDR